MQPTVNAIERGYSDVLWVSGEEHNLSEIGSLNAFVVLKNTDGSMELVTPPLDGTILPGVTRQSVLELGGEMEGVHISERNISMKELVEASDENRYHVHSS